ncbi:MAG: DUF2029 domain-containing protein [Candidatus Eremiobacteraeota bacterium]|nr:DUF2029 domain-containing protein [Candidatus Eremiobacteraeota bacterium]
MIVAANIGPRFVRHGVPSPLTNPADFRAFYCAGEVVVARGNPFTVEPLRSCEQHATAEMGLQPLPLMVNPAPQPPFALVAFSVGSLVPFGSASCAWFVILTLCTIGTVAVLRRLSRAPSAVLALGVLCANFLAMLSGELGPVVIFGIVYAALAFSQRKFACAAAMLAVASIQPQVALPVWVALIVFRREMRPPLAVVACVLIVVPIIVLGPSIWFDYLGKELPAHASSELHAPAPQYSLATLLASFVSDRVALVLAQLDYGVMLVVGVIVARRLADRFTKPELLVLIPPIFTTLGGPYVHLYQFTIAIPGAICLLSCVDARVVRPMAFVIGAVLVGMALDIGFSSSLYAVADAGFARRMLALGPTGLASVAARYWHESHIPTDEYRLLAIGILKIPALAALIVFVIATVRLATRPFLEINDKPDRSRIGEKCDSLSVAG